jgi:hypothetical protein
MKLWDLIKENVKRIKASQLSAHHSLSGGLELNSYFRKTFSVIPNIQ